MLLFLKVFFTEFIAEMGDKTQLMLIALTSKYKLKDIIMGTAAAILVLNGLAVLAGGLVSEFIPEWLIKIVAAFAFLYFAASTLAGDEDEEEEDECRRLCLHRSRLHQTSGQSHRTSIARSRIDR